MPHDSNKSFEHLNGHHTAFFTFGLQTSTVRLNRSTRHYFDREFALEFSPPDPQVREAGVHGFVGFVPMSL